MSNASFDCPNCGKAYRWQTKIAGRKVRCACTQTFRVPMVAGEMPEPVGPLVGQGGADAQPPSQMPPAPTTAPKPAAPEPDPYELNLPADEPAGETAPISARSTPVGQASGGGKCPACNSPLRPGAVICLNCGYNLAEGAKVQTVVEAAPAEDGLDLPAAAAAGGSFVPAAAASAEERVAARSKLQEDLAADMAKRHHFQEKLLPLIFLGVGALLLLINAFVLMTPTNRISYDMPDGAIGNVVALIGFSILFAVQLPCLFVGILIVSKLFGSAFGELFTALKKLAALALLSGQFDVAVELTFNTLLDGMGFLAFWIELAVSFAVFWALAKQLFDELEPGETVALWIAMLFLPGFIVGALLFFIAGML
ncbi:MAG: hypothetical protein AAGF84_14680 [Planctomycetota bacterium]